MEEKEINSKKKGIICIIGAALSFSLMTLFLKESGELPTMQKAFFRNFVAAIVTFCLLLRSDEKLYIKKESLPSLFMRAGFGTAGLIANFWAIDHLVLADSNVLNKMSPFFAMIMSIFVLKEKPDKVEWLTIFIAFVGAILVVKPTRGIASLPALVGLFSGFGAGTAYAYVRKLGKIGERREIIVLFFSVFSCIICLPFMIFNYESMTTVQLILLICAGISAMSGQLFITSAYTYAPAKEISVFDYSQVLFAALWGILFFGEKPDVLSISGYVIIIVTAILKWNYNIKKGV